MCVGSSPDTSGNPAVLRSRYVVSRRIDGGVLEVPPDTATAYYAVMIQPDEVVWTGDGRKLRLLCARGD
jgi:hypothetical protein